MTKRVKYIIILFFILLYSGYGYAQISKDITAKINVFREDIYMKLDAIVENNEQIFNHKLNYILYILKKNKNTKKFTKDDRYGEFTILPNEKKTIITLKINLQFEEEVKAYLFIKNQKQLIAIDSIKINENIEILKTTAISENDIEIKGLIVENVKTKIGKDFYDLFYQKYNQSGASYPFVININEKPFIGGRAALVSIEVGDDKIFEFQARPNDEMLQKATEYTLKLIENYSKTRNTFEKIY